MKTALLGLFALTSMAIAKEFPPGWLPVQALDDKPSWSEFRKIDDRIHLYLPGGETPEFPLEHSAYGPNWAEAGIVKDAGDDPDVTHGCTVIARVQEGGAGVTFHAGEGVGTVTKAGLPIPPGEPAINPSRAT